MAAATRAAGPTPVLRTTSAVLAVALVLVVVAGVQLFVLSTRTDDYFAWTIKVPLTAAFLGAGYWATVPMIAWALTRREWQRVRIVVVLALVLTVFTLAATLWRLELFHLRTGSSSGRAAGWAWLVVYVAIPIMLAASVVRQEAAGGRREFVVEEPLMPLFRALLAVYGAGLGVLGLGLSFWPSAFHHVWAWPVPPLPAGAVGGWLIAIGFGCLWALREADWRRVQVAYPALVLYWVLLLIGAARFSGDFSGGRRWPYVAAAAASLVLFAVAGWLQVRKRPVDASSAAVPGPTSV